MASTETGSLRYIAKYVIRPTLVEAKLITKKHADDPVYMATLAEELLNIEAKIATLEETAQLGASDPAVQSNDRRGPEDWSDADWIRTKSSDLELRLCRVEQASKER